MSDITKLSAKEIDAAISALQEESIGLSVEHLADPEYKALTERLSEIKREYFEKHAERQEVIGGSIKNYTEELARRKKAKTKGPLKLPERLAQVIQDMHRGVTYGPAGLVPVAVWDERFVLIKRPGHAGWSSRGSRSYIPTAYTLHDLHEYIVCSMRGSTLFFKTTIWEAPEGTKLNKALIDAAELATVIRVANEAQDR